MRIRKCPVCNRYTLKQRCCTDTVSAHPPKLAVVEKITRFNKMRKEASNNENKCD